jgi:hypothetical protein
MKFTILAFLGLVFSSSIFAQSSEDLEHYSALYPDAQLVGIKHIDETDIKIGKEGIEVLERSYVEDFYLSSNSSLFADKSISYGFWTEIKSIDAYTMVPNGDKYKKKKVDDFKVKDEFTSGIFYDDRKSTNFYLPSLQKGAKSVVDYTRAVGSPYLTSSAYFGSFYPVEYMEFVVRCDEGVKITWKEFHMENVKVDFTTTVEKGRTIYKWTCSNIPRIIDEQFAPNLAYYAPHIIVYINSYEFKGENKLVLNDVGDLYRWYISMVKDVNKEDNENLRQLTDSLTLGAKSDREKVEAIFYWTQDNIKYVAVEAGLGGLIPREAAYVCEKRYGDCKDMASIITEMCKYAGVETHMTWIGSRDIPYTYEEMPAPVVDNHMIATYIDGDDIIFLDATGKRHPFGTPTAFIQGKQALIRISDDDYRLAKVPPVAAANNQRHESITMRIDDGTVMGQSKTILSGYYRGLYLDYYHYTDKKDHEVFYKSWFEKGNNKCYIDNVTMLGESVRDGDLEVDYDFRIENFVVRDDDELIINMNLAEPYGTEGLKDDRVSPKSFRYNSLVSFTTELEIPEGYMASVIPENAEFTLDDFNFNFTYTQTGNRIILDQKITVNNLMIEESSFADWNEMVKKLRKSYKSSVVLKKIP